MKQNKNDWFWKTKLIYRNQNETLNNETQQEVATMGHH